MNILYKLKDNNFLLDYRKAIYWEEESALLISDLHLGKSEHFQKSGIAVPNQSGNYDRLSSLINDYTPNKIYFLGDLFHSVNNNSSVDFLEFFRNYKVQKHLILGNHDILGEEKYSRLDLTIHKKLKIRELTLIHDPDDALNDEYSLAGHIHPKVRLRGAGRQYLSLSCFFFGISIGVLPAFGDFTGGYNLKPRREDDIFVIAENEIIKM